jgi:hypothetical protein
MGQYFEKGPLSILTIFYDILSVSILKFGKRPFVFSILDLFFFKKNEEVIWPLRWSNLSDNCREAFVRCS